MPLKKIRLTAGPESEGLRLDHFLAQALPRELGEPVSKAKVRKLVVAGAVYLNGKRVRIASKELRAGARIELYVDLEALKSGADRADAPFAMTAAHVLFEDDWLIAVDKPPGLPTQPTLDEARANLFAAVKKFLAARDGSIDPYVGLHHRLDRDTSGVILFTKAREANAGVAAAFAEHRAAKVYQALCARPAGGRGLPRREWSVRDFLGKAPGAGKRSKFASVRAGGDPAHTDFRVLEELARGLRIEARPRTGRTHQIRVHLSEAGLPILGDALYGGPTSVAPRVMLHAESLTLAHPRTGAELVVRSRLPKDFEACLAKLRVKT